MRPTRSSETPAPPSHPFVCADKVADGDPREQRRDGHEPEPSNAPAAVVELVLLVDRVCPREDPRAHAHHIAVSHGARGMRRHMQQQEAHDIFKKKCKRGIGSFIARLPMNR